MKIFRRNAIIITVILFVCVAVYLNWSYNQREGELAADAEDASAAGLFYSTADESTPASSAAASLAAKNDYFASARLSRQQARDSAVNTLKEASEAEGATTDTVDSTITAISVMSRYSVEEAEIESLVMAKGFEECIAFVDEDRVIVAVPAPAEGLSVSAVSRITDVVMSQTGCSTQQIRIIEVK